MDLGVVPVVGARGRRRRRRTWRPNCRRSRARPLSSARSSPYWQARYGLPPAKVVAWSGDNPCSLVGVGLVREGRLADLARHERHRVRPDARAARRRHGHRPRVRRADRRLHGADLLQERIARARARSAIEFGLSWPTFSEASPHAAGKRRPHHAAVVRAGDHADGA